MTSRIDPRPRWPLRPPPEHLQRRYVEAGFWLDGTLGAFVDERLRAGAELELRIWSKTRPFRGTIGEVREVASRVAGGLRAAGVGAGDVVAFQLPNWMEAAATFYGASLLGAVLVPIVHFYGAKEVRYILAHTRAKALVTAATFRQSDYLAALATFRDELPELETVVVVGEHAPVARTIPFDALLVATPLVAPQHVDPREPAVIGFTSGTTSDPKGVIHSHHTIVAEARPARRHAGRPRAAGAGRGAGRTRDRHAVGPADPALPAQKGDPPDRPLGSADHPRRDARGGPHLRQRCDLLPHQPARRARLHRRAPEAHDHHRPRRRAGAGGDLRSRREHGDLDRALLRLDRAPVVHRGEARGAGREAQVHRRPRAVGRRAEARRARTATRFRSGSPARS